MSAIGALCIVKPSGEPCEPIQCTVAFGSSLYGLIETTAYTNAANLGSSGFGGCGSACAELEAEFCAVACAKTCSEALAAWPAPIIVALAYAKVTGRTAHTSAAIITPRGIGLHFILPSAPLFLSLIKYFVN